MRSIETTVTVSADGKLTLQLPADIPPGQHRVVLVIDERIDSPVSSTYEIDAAFAEMSDDAEYQAEARQIEAEFATAQWEALQAIEAEL